MLISSYKHDDGSSVYRNLNHHHDDGSSLLE